MSGVNALQDVYCKDSPQPPIQTAGLPLHAASLKAAQIQMETARLLMPTSK